MSSSSPSSSVADMFIVDSFASIPYSGNPAAVCLLPWSMDMDTNENSSSRMMQIVAREMNLSETAFVSPSPTTSSGDDRTKRFRLRWFTPTVEVPLCGHATLATAHVLFSERPHMLRLENGETADAIVFETVQAGDLTVRRRSGQETYSSSSQRPLLEMDFPQGRPRPLDRETCPLLSDRKRNVLGKIFRALSLDEYADDPWQIVVDVKHCEPTRKLLIEVDSLSHILRAQLRSSMMTDIDFGESYWTEKIKGVILTTCNISDEYSQQYGKYDFVSRYFAPWLGIPEDPVNGSCHTTQVVHYGQKLSKNSMLAFQRSERGGELQVELVPNSDRMLMRGTAVTVLRGTIDLP